jgi:hypothetical protein
LLIWDAPLLIPLNKGLEMEYLGARGKREMQGAWGIVDARAHGEIAASAREIAGTRARGFGAAATEQRIRRDADGNYWSLPNAN